MEEDQRLLERILDGAEDPTNLSLTLLQDITDNFSEERIIGQGGFGTVYKGVLGERIVAVKGLHINVHTVDGKLFRREATRLLKINHRNVVRFLGVCSQGYKEPIDQDGSGKYFWANVFERFHCFEYISNGSLDKHITDELRGLEWEARYEIITGICKGLRYLHTEREIIHMDLKPENILLDHQDGKYMVPKITDFSLSRLDENSHTKGVHYGTFGYSAPEYTEEGKTTPSCDIYSLGLIIIELVTGCKHIPDKNNVLRRWRHRWNNPPTQLQYQQVTRCIDIAVQCREQNPKDRPSISKIISFLIESESTHCKISPCFDEDDMLGIKPLEQRLPSELKNEISYTVELTNGTHNCMAFIIHLPSAQYNVQPEKGIVRPLSKYIVKITVQARDVRQHDHDDKLIVQSMQVDTSEGLREEDIREDIFCGEASKVVDEVDLIVVYEPTKPEGTNMPAEEVPKLNQGEYSGYTHNKKRKNSLSATEPMTMTFQELHHMTDGFSEKRLLGTGAFGRVYKGVLGTGEVIAVKKLNAQHGQNDNTFENELQNLMRAKHQNVVSLVGYCSEEQDKVVVYKGKTVTAVELVRALCLEYMEGGTLDKLLSDESLGWEARYKIIKGICQGLKYLHKESKHPIYHLDLKPANILMDKNGIPKIGDFGLSRLLASTGTFVTETRSGTRGYMPPEYEYQKQISSKFDVFSLGVIIIEIIAGSEGYYNYKCIMSHQDFINHVTGKWSKRVQANTMSTEQLQEVQKCIEMALRCVEDKREKRPTITEIVKELMPEKIDLHLAPFCSDIKDLESLQMNFKNIDGVTFHEEENNQEDGDEEHVEDAYDYKNYSSEEDDEDCFSSKDHDKSDEGKEANVGAYQENGAQPSAEVQYNTSKVEVIEAQEHFGRMSINSDVPPKSLHLVVGSEVRTEDLGSLPLPSTSLSNLALCSWPGRAEAMANFPVDISNDLIVQQGNHGLLDDAVGQYLDRNQASPARHIGIAASAAAAQPQGDDSCQAAFWANLVTDSDEGAEDNDNDLCQDAFWDNLLTDSDNEGEAAAGQVCEA